MAKHTLLSIDIGTTNTKGIIINEGGTVLAKSSEKNALIIPYPSAAEQNADEWWHNVVNIIRDLRAKAGNEAMDNIAGICVSSQTVTVLPLDKEGLPLRNAIIWMDSRSEKEFNYISASLGYDKYVRIAGAKPSVTFLPGKLLWLKNNEPHIFDNTYKFVQASSYINYKLTGRITMDIAQASMSQAMDCRTLKWSDEIAKVTGIDLNSVMPEVFPVGEIIGEVSASAASETGLKKGIPVVAGASDCMTAMYATGINKIGDGGESSGTTSMIFAGTDRKSRPDAPVTTKPCDIPGMPYVFDAPLTATGASVEWFLNTAGKSLAEEAVKNRINIFDHMNNTASAVRAGSSGVLYYPYLQGERAPLWNSHARGMFIGLSVDTTVNDLSRAVFEGTAYAIRHVVEAIRAEGAPVNSLRITGGGAKSRTWARIKASVLNVPVYLMDEKTGDVPFGGALIAGRSVGIFKDFAQTIKELAKPVEIIEPVREWTAYYDEVFPLFLSIYEHLDEDLKRFEEINR